MAERVVVDASAMVDLLVGSLPAASVRERLHGRELHVPAHFDAEVLSALGRLHRAGRLSARQAAVRIRRVAEAPMERHPLAPLLAEAWKLRHNLRLLDAIYVVLARRLEAPVVTTDAGLAAVSSAFEQLGR